ncbi:MAG: glycosyltransferase family 1 protein, partial [Thaumarchaeota archaeon]|nr:glycosyltransferase family 1 protein [Nitrososphaerota archaeon]
NGWIKKLSILIDDNKKARQMGMNGHNFVKENFSWDKIARKFLDMLNLHGIN